MIWLGAYFSIRKYEKRIKKTLVPESNFNKNSLLILKRAENFMLFKTLWTMVGTTIWSLRNIVNLFEIYNHDCYFKGNKIDKFFIVNFYIWTLLGYILAFITFIVLPGTALYQCYRLTDR